MTVSPDILQLMDLFEGRSERELRTILSRHEGDLESAVADILDGETATFGNDEGSKMRRSSPGLPEHIPWSTEGSHEKNAVSRGSAAQVSGKKLYEKKKGKPPGATSGMAAGQFASLGASRTGTYSSFRRPGLGEDSTDNGSMPVSMPVSMNSSVTTSTGTVSGTTWGGIAGSRDTDSGALQAGAFPMNGPNGARPGTAGDNGGYPETPIAAEVVTRTGSISDTIREELRDEIRQEIQAMSEPIAAAEVVVPHERGDEETGTSQLTGESSMGTKKSRWQSRKLWIVATVLLLAVIGGLVGVILGIQSARGGSSESNELGGGTNTGGSISLPTNTPSDAPTTAPSFLETAPPVNSQPVSTGPTFFTPLPSPESPTVSPVNQQAPSPSPTTSPVIGSTPPPTPLPVREPTPRPTDWPTPKPTNRNDGYCRDKYGSSIDVCEERSSECTFFVTLDDRSCSDYCSGRGGKCLSARGDEGGNCRFGNSHSCNDDRTDTICTCSLDDMSPRPTPWPTPRPTHSDDNDLWCRDKYGSSIDVCEERSSECTFFVTLNDKSCDDYCSDRDGSCLSARNDEGGNCRFGDSHSCSDDKGDTICTCSFGGVAPTPTPRPTTPPSPRPITPPTPNPTSPPTSNPITPQTPRPTPRPTPKATNNEEDDETCRDKYGGSIDVCEESSSECTFFVTLNDRSCDDFCDDRSGRCLSARGDEGGNCNFGNSHSCGDDRSDTICTCTL